MSYSGRYDFSTHELQAAEPIADWLMPLRARAAAWDELDEGANRPATVAELRDSVTFRTRRPTATARAR